MFLPLSIFPVAVKMCFAVFGPLCKKLAKYQKSKKKYCRGIKIPYQLAQTVLPVDVSTGPGPIRVRLRWQKKRELYITPGQARGKNWRREGLTNFFKWTSCWKYLEHGLRTSKFTLAWCFCCLSDLKIHQRTFYWTQQIFYIIKAPIHGCSDIIQKSKNSSLFFMEGIILWKEYKDYNCRM